MLAGGGGHTVQEGKDEAVMSEHRRRGDWSQGRSRIWV